jgi:hypothetical protein
VNPNMAHDIVAQHLQDTRAAARAARLGSALRATRRSASRASMVTAGPESQRHWLTRRA